MRNQNNINAVSTHSRLKAAGTVLSRLCAVMQGFNTQPPEGGWTRNRRNRHPVVCFNTQPPEGGWVGKIPAAGLPPCFNTQPPEGGWG